MPVPNYISTALVRHLTTTVASSPAKLQNCLTKIPIKYRGQVIKESQQILADYLHSTRSIPFSFAECIVNNSVNSLNNLISNSNLFPFSTYTFSKAIQKRVRYHPINEFEFFFESIGIEYSLVSDFLPPNKFFFYEDRVILDVAQALASFGFPWNKLGILYNEQVSIFRNDLKELTERLDGFKRVYDLTSTNVTAICLAFPYVLSGSSDLNGEIDRLFTALKTVFVKFELDASLGGDVDDWLGICRKIKLFHDVGCDKDKEKTWKLIGSNKRMFLDHSEEHLTRTIEYFCRFDVNKSDVELVLLQIPEILGFDLEKRAISVMGLLRHFGLDEEKLKDVSETYPHVLGRNKMVNLPHVMRAMDLHNWLFDKIINGSHQLLGNYVLGYPNEDIDGEFIDTIIKIEHSRYPLHTMHKLNFLHGIGFGENMLTVKVLAKSHGSSSQLQERVGCLLRAGITLSKLCIMIKYSPKILNQNSGILESKINFLCNEMGSSIDQLYSFPAFLNFNLEKRIEPRYRFHMWLMEKGLQVRNYAIASMVATSDKNFVARLYGIHPAAPKHWFEFLSCKNDTENGLET